MLVPFDEQVAKAKLISSGPQRLADLRTVKLSALDGQTVAGALEKNDASFFSKQFQDPEFASFVSDAYNSKDGYAIRINPLTGEKEMVVAGTRNAKQWGLNLLDGVLYNADRAINFAVNNAEKLEGLVGADFGLPPGYQDKLPKADVDILERLDIPRQEKTRFFEQIAKENGVKVIYGHSRGGAIVADMKVPGISKVGLDSAMAIAHDTDMKNFYEGGKGLLINPLGAFDAAIGTFGKDNEYLDENLSSFHQVWTKDIKK